MYYCIMFVIMFKSFSNMKIFEYWYSVLFLYYYYLVNAIFN